MEPGSEAAGFTERLAQVVECFGPPPHECSFMQIVRRTGLPRASVHRMIGQLTAVGWLEPGPGGRGHRLGARLVWLLHAQLDADRLQALTAPVLTGLAQDSGAASFAARLVQGQVDLFATATPENPGLSHVFPGIGIRPVHACSSAKALVAFQPDSLRRALLAAPRERFTGQTLTGDADLTAEHARIRRDGYAVCDGEINAGVVSLAVPVRLPRLGPVYALGLIALADRLAPPHRPAAVQLLNRAAARLATLLDPAPGLLPALSDQPEIRHDPAS
ncbi:IclR family transcriptional regulator [Xinfangfangia pollutisoli]|uniref:IclR family transcriptional regulator n=1 Tax=Xinfangfangia pollutisoli TaxID=2865960 RepID=UPI001CD47E60|nr:IclR family transcriptional regulator [Xinfangfangia pollutisoli]